VTRALRYGFYTDPHECCVIAHIVIATWKAGVAREQIRKVKSDFFALTTKIPEIEKVHWGESLATEDGEQRVAVVMLAKNLEAIDAYHALPDHVPFAEMVVSMTSSLTGGSYQL
jgi:hypothetical protein